MREIIINRNAKESDDHLITMQKDLMVIELKHKNQDYFLEFADDNYKNIKIIIKATENNVTLANGTLSCYSIDLQCENAYLDKSLNVYANGLRIAAKKGENHATLRLDVLDIAISEDGSGIINYGHIYLDKIYRQKKGSFVNRNIFFPNMAVFMDAGLILNDTNGSWHSRSAAHIKSVCFLNYGRYDGDQSDIESEVIEIRNRFGAAVAKLSAMQSLHIASETDIFCKHLIAVSQDILMIEGMIANTENGIFLAKDILISASAKFDNCRQIQAAAEKTLKCQAGTSFNKVASFNASASYLDVESSITTTDLIALEGRDYNIIHKGTVLTSPLHQLRGRKIYFYGKTRGQLDFPDIIEHLYLAHGSVIDGCDKINPKALIIESYGKVVTFAHILSAKYSITTGDNSSVTAVSSELDSEFMRIAGRFGVNILRSKARLQAQIEPQAVFANALSEISAPFVNLDGLMSGSVNAKANILLNSATIENGGHVDLGANDLLVNKPDAEINSQTSRQRAQQLLNYGRTNTAAEAKETAGTIYHAAGSSASAADSAIHGIDVAINGEINGSSTVTVTSNNSTDLLKDHLLSGGKVVVQSHKDVRGHLNVNSDNATIAANGSVDIHEGEVGVQDVFVVAGRSVQLGVNAESRVVRLQPIMTDKPAATSLILPASSSITAEEFVETFTRADIAADLRVTTALLNSQQLTAIAESASVEFGENLTILTDNAYIAGSVSQPVGAASEKASMHVNSQEAAFSNTSSVTTRTPVHVETVHSVYDGEMEVPLLYNNARKTEFGPHCAIGRKTGSIQLTSNADNSEVDVAPGAYVGSQSLQIASVNSLKIEGELSPLEMSAKLKNLHIAAFGKLGASDTKMFIDSDYVTLHGNLEADTASFKVNRVFLQNGLRGQAKIKAKNLNIQSVVYANLFGRTDAHQFSVASFISLFLGVEFVNYKTSNSFIKIGFSLRAPQPEFLAESIQHIRNGEIELVNGQFLQNSLQTFLALMQPLFPALTAAVGLGINSYYLYNNLSQLYKNIEELRNNDDIRLVDLLPSLVAMSNSINSGTSLFNNASVLADKYKHTFSDTFNDISDYLNNDLLSDIRDQLRTHQDKNESEHPSSKNDKNDQTDNSGKKQETDTNDMPSPTSMQNLQNWWNELDGVRFAHDVLSRAIVPALSVFMPSTYENALVNLNFLSPQLGFTNNQRGIFTISAASPFAGAVNSETGYALLGDWSRHYSYVESLSGYYVHKGADSYAHDFSVHSSIFSLGRGNRVRAANAHIREDHLRPHDVKGTDNLTLEYSTTDNEDDLLQLQNEYSVFQPEDSSITTIHYKTNHGLKFCHNFHLPWSCVFEGTDIYVADGVTLESDAKTLGLVSTRESITNNGMLKAKTVFEDSADRIDQTNGGTESEKLYLHAVNDINLIRSKNFCDEGAIISDRGSVLVEAGQVKFKHFGYVSAHNDVVAKCESQEIKTHGKPDKSYTAGEIIGGDGKDHDCMGLYVTARKIWNIGSVIGADRNYFLDADSVIGDAAYNNYLKHHHKHKNIFGKKSETYEYDVRIQRPTFRSKNGRGFIRAKRGNVSTLCAEFDSKFSTYIFSHDKPEFRDMAVRKVKTKKSSWLGVNYYQNYHVEEKMEGQIFDSPQMLHVESYDDIVIRNSSIQTDLLVTDSWNGKTTIEWDKIRHYDETSYLTLSVNLGPLHYSHTFDHNAKHKDSVTYEDPLLSGIKSMKHVKGADGKICGAVNTADAAASKLNAIGSGNYGQATSSSVGVNVSHTRSVSRYETQSRKKFEVGTWHDFSAKGISLNGVSGAIGMLDMHCGTSLAMNGQVLEYESHSATQTVGASFDVITNRLDASASITDFKTKGRTAAPAQINISRLIFRNAATISLNNAQLRVKEMHGTASVTMNSAYDDTTQTMTSVSASTNGNVSVSHSHVRAHEVNSPSFMEVSDMSDAHITTVDSVGGELRGEGFKDHQPDTVHQTRLASSRHETGFAFAGNPHGHTVSSVGYTNSVDSFTTGSRHKHHGTNIALNTPANLFSFFAQRVTAIQPATANQDHDDQREFQSPAQAPAIEADNSAPGNDNVTPINPAAEEIRSADSANINEANPSPSAPANTDDTVSTDDNPDNIDHDSHDDHDANHHHLPHLPEFPSAEEGGHIFGTFRGERVLGLPGESVYTGMLAGCYMLTAYTATSDALSFYEAYEQSLEQHSIHPALEEATRIGFSWAGAYQAGTYALPILEEFAEGAALAARFGNPWSAAAITAGMIASNTLGYNVGGSLSHYVYQNTVNSMNVIGSQFAQSARVSYEGFKNFGQTFFGNDFRMPTPIGAPVPIWRSK